MPSKQQSKLASSRARDDAVTPPGPSVEGERLLTKPEVLAKTGLSYPTVWRLMTRGAFPRSRQIASTHKVCWVNSEIDRWISQLPCVPLKGDV